MNIYNAIKEISVVKFRERALKTKSIAKLE